MSAKPDRSDRPRSAGEALDEAEATYRRAGVEAGLTPRDRMYGFHQSTLLLVEALIRSLRESDQRHARELELTRERFAASGGAMQQQLTQTTLKLERMYSRLQDDLDRYIGELERRADEMLEKKSIADESAQFFMRLDISLNKFNSLLERSLGQHLCRMAEKGKMHVDVLNVVCDELSKAIATNCKNAAKHIARDVAYEVRSSDQIVDQLTNEGRKRLSEAVMSSFNDYTSSAIFFMMFVFILGVLTGTGINLFGPAKPSPGAVEHSRPR